MLRRDELSDSERRATIKAVRYIALDEVDELQPSWFPGDYLLYIRPWGPGEVGMSVHVATAALAPYIRVAPEARPASEADEAPHACAGCGKRAAEHYAFSLHEGEPPISVCEPGQYTRRWRAEPTPEADEHVERGGDLYVAAALPRGCHRHSDCRAADERWLAAHLSELHVPSSWHMRPAPEAGERGA